jgi:hypothetical protein
MSMTQYSVKMWLNEGDQFEGTLAALGGEKLHISITAPKTSTYHAGLLPLQGDVRKIELTGELTRAGKKQAFRKAFRCIDITDLTASLYAPVPSFARRLRLLQERLDLYAIKEGFDDELDLNIQMNEEPALSTEAVQAFTKRFGLAMRDPTNDFDQLTEWVDLASHNITIGDSLLLQADGLVPALQIMERDDGQPDDLLDEQPQIKALYQRSVILCRQIGDGTGYLLWDTQTVHDCYWVHQESIFQPKLLRYHNGEVMHIQSALALCIAAHELSAVDDYCCAQDYDEVTIDQLHPAGGFKLFFGESRPQLKFMGFDCYGAFHALPD